MAVDVWESCADVLARLESRLSTSIDRQIFRSTATDLVDSFPALSSVEISYTDSGQLQTLGAAGDRRSDPCSVQSRAEITDQSELAIKIWSADWQAIDPSTRSAIDEMIDAIGGLMVSAICRIRLQELTDQSQSISEMADGLFAEGSPPTRFHRIAAELSISMSVDRLSLLRRVERGYQFIGSSVQLQFDPRADRVLQTQAIGELLAERLSSQTLETGRFSGGDNETIAKFLDEGDGVAFIATRFVGGQILAVGEVLDAAQRLPTEQDQSAELGHVHRALFDAALATALAKQPMRKIDRVATLFKQRSNRRRILVAAVLLVLLTCYPMTIWVAVDGRVVPQSQHVVYAPVTGQLERLECESGTHVAAGQVLCEFSSHDLDIDVTRVRGEMLTVQEQLQIATTRRGDTSSDDVASDRRVLEARLAGLTNQLAVLQRRQSELVVSSPLDGIVNVVMPNDLGAQRTPRPVERGQSIIRIINPSAGFHLEMEVPEREIGYVLDSIDHNEIDPVRCRFRIRSRPERERFGTFTGLEQAATLNRFGRLVTIASFDPDELDDDFAADSGVTGWIDCDRAPAGFVMFRTVIEQLRLWGLL